MKNILAENLLRFGVKNLNETDKVKLAESVLLEQTQEAKNALNALNTYLWNNPLALPKYEGRSRGTAEMTWDRDVEIVKIKRDNPSAPDVKIRLKFRNGGTTDPTTKAFKLTKITLDMNLTQETIDAYEKLAPGFTERAKADLFTVGILYHMSQDITVAATDTVATVETNIRKYYPGNIDRNLLSTMLTLYGVKA